MCEDMFAIRQYEGYKNMKDVNCIICSRTFQAPCRFGDRVTTCCYYCQTVALSLKKMKGRYALCATCDKPTWVMPNNKYKRHYCSRECANLGWSIYYQIDFGEEKINTGRKKYYGANWLFQRERARKRDCYACQRCGVSEEEYGKELSVHHITPFVYFETYQEANVLENLLSVCEPCHRKIHSGDNHHYKFDKDKIIFNNELNSVSAQQKELAIKVVELLFNSDLNLTEISKETGMSYGGVSRIYKGQRWKEFYDEPAKELKPRSVGSGKII